jgi:hypothetical protein
MLLLIASAGCQEKKAAPSAGTPQMQQQRSGMTEKMQGMKRGGPAGGTSGGMNGMQPPGMGGMRPGGGMRPPGTQ